MLLIVYSLSRVFSGAHHLTSPPSQVDSLLAMFDPLSSGEGNLLSENARHPIRELETSAIKSLH